MKLEVSFAAYMGCKHFVIRSPAGNCHKEQSTYVFSKVEGMYVGWFIFEMCSHCCAINSFRGNDWREFQENCSDVYRVIISEYTSNMKNNIQRRDWRHCNLRFPVIDNHRTA
jgi:hypothetical protein